MENTVEKVVEEVTEAVVASNKKAVAIGAAVVIGVGTLIGFGIDKGRKLIKAKRNGEVVMVVEDDPTEENDEDTEA